MATYTRSDLAFAGDTLFSATPVDFADLLINNLATLSGLIFAGTATQVTLNTATGTVTLSGNFSFALIAGPGVHVTGSLTGVSQDTAGGNVETVSSFTFPLDFTV